MTYIITTNKGVGKQADLVYHIHFNTVVSRPLQMAGPWLLREGSRLQPPQNEGWSNWEKAMVPEEKNGDTKNRGKNQVGFIWKNILEEDTIPCNLCGIYE